LKIKSKNGVGSRKRLKAKKKDTKIDSVKKNIKQPKCVFKPNSIPCRDSCTSPPPWFVWRDNKALKLEGIA
jgi:hypothetical protein